MSRIGFRECGFLLEGETPHVGDGVDPTVGWFWPFREPSLALSVGTVDNMLPTDFFRLFWNIRRVRVSGVVTGTIGTETIL